MTIERFAGLNDEQKYSVLIFNESTKKTVKGLKVTGRELQALARALDALVKQQFAIDGINDKQAIRQDEAIEAYQHIPNTGDNPLGNAYGNPEDRYEQTFMNPQAPTNPGGFNQPPLAITENPGNQKPPKLP